MEKTIPFSARNVRFVRDWLNGSTANSGNHWVEIQVWGRATVAYVGNYLEWYSNGTTGSPRTMAKYYYAGDQRVAMRHSSGTGMDGLVYLLSDHLGSTSRTVDPLAAANDNKPNVLTQLRFKPCGETRYFTGEAGTDFRFTGQTSDYLPSAGINRSRCTPAASSCSRSHTIGR